MDPNIQITLDMIRDDQLGIIAGLVPKVLVDLYAHCGNGHQEPTLGDLQNQFLMAFSSAFIILDALYECNEEKDFLT